MQNWLNELDGKLAVAGVMGAILALAVRPTKTIWGGFITVLSGLGAAVYMTPLVNHFLKLPETLYGGLGFIIGLTSMPVAGWILKKVVGWLDVRVK